MKYGKNNLWMQDLGDRFRLYNICLDDKLWTVDQSKELLDDGRSQTKDGWNKWLKSEANKEKWQLASGPVYHAVLAALHYNQDHPDKKQRKIIKECREMHKKKFRDDRMMTSTRIVYQPQGMDKIIHNYGTPEQKEIELAFVGPNPNYITKDSGLEQEMKALLGTNNLDEVEQVYENLTGNKPYLWRFYIKPEREEQRALVLGVSGIFSFDIITGYLISDIRPACGWSVSPQGAPVYDSSLQGALSLVGDAGNISLTDTRNLSLK